MTKLYPLAFALGLATLAWIGLGFVGTSWLALLMTAVIAAVYVFGFLELRHFRAATAALRAALEGTTATPASLAAWLEAVPATLRTPVRLRVQGERAAWPGPALSPYLVGLLVMLGMLGTFLGMIVTFRGAVFALEGSADLQAIRSALAAPVKGLGLAFGTSVAGVAASALLGLMLAVARRERLEVARQLDGCIAGVLQPFSRGHQREESFRALQAQAHAMPQALGQLEVILSRMEQRSQQLDAQLLQRQGELQREVTRAYGELAQRVAATLADSVAASAKAAGDAVRPVVEATLAQLAADAQRLHERLGETARAQADDFSRRLEGASLAVAEAWGSALQRHAQAGSEQDARLQARLEAFTRGLEQRSVELVSAVQDSAARSHAELARNEQQRLQTWSDTLRSLGSELTALVRKSEDLVRARTEGESRWLALQGERMDQLATLWRAELSALRDEERQRGEAAIERLEALRQDEQQRGNAAIERLEALREDEQQRGNATLERLEALREDERQRGDAVIEHLQALRDDERLRADAAVAQLGELQGSVARHLATLGAALEAPLTRLLQTASEVPQAAAGVIAQLREEMGRLAERDNLALAERDALMERLRTLLQAVAEGADEQRAAGAALVASATSVLEQAGARFAAALEAQAGKAADAAAHVAASAVEVASLAEAFGQGMDRFQAGNDKLVEGLERMEASLRRSTARSDEQLAYYVAQAREVIDLSVASQQDLVESLRLLRGKPAPGSAAVAASRAEAAEATAGGAAA